MNIHILRVNKISKKIIFAIEVFSYETFLIYLLLIRFFFKYFSAILTILLNILTDDIFYIILYLLKKKYQYNVHKL